MSWGADRVVVGHRGGRGEGWPPENTIAAFERAAREGADAIELDVRTTSDGAAVVFHDVRLDRMTRGDDRRLVAEVSRAELSRVRLDGEPIPTLADALAWARGKGLGVNLEVKHDVPARFALARAVAREVRRAVGADVLFSSFDPALLAMLAALAPRVPRAYLTHAGQRGLPHALREAARPGALFALHLERTETDPAKVARFRARGLRVGVWTVNDPREASDLVALGASIVITDAPAAIRAAVEA